MGDVYLRFLKNHLSSIILLTSMVIGFILGLILKEDAAYLESFGVLFINLLSCTIIPIVFVTITLAIAKIKPQKAFRLLRKIATVFIMMSLISLVVGLISTYAFRLVSTDNTLLQGMLSEGSKESVNVLDKFMSMFSVSDFAALLSKDNIIALIVFSLITGFAINMTKDKKEYFVNLLESTNNILMNIIKIIMYYAPIGICAYFATLVGSLGASIAKDYLIVFIYYTVISFVFAIVVYSLIALLCGKSVKTFWKESLPVILCSLSTCSSAACMPINIKATKNLGVPEEVSDTTISLGTSFHKDGSVIDSVFKIMFLVYLFNSDVGVLQVALVAIVASLLITAVPVGGGTISEMLILTLLGFPIYALPILTIIATITDAPATMLNSLGDTASSLWVHKLMKRYD